MNEPTLKLYELCNPSDPYTFYAPSVEIAAAVVLQISSHFGARQVDGDEQTPVLFGWEEWLTARGIDAAFIDAHLVEIADGLESFLIGGASRRADVESMLAMLPEEKREQWRAERQNRHRSSLNQIGEFAYERAKRIRRLIERQTTTTTAAE